MRITDSCPSFNMVFIYSLVILYWYVGWQSQVFAYLKMHETVNIMIFWRSVSKCQVPVLQFLSISKLLILGINNNTFEYSMAKPEITNWGQYSRQTEVLFAPGSCSLTSDFICDISSLPWSRQLNGAVTWSSVNSPLVEKASRGKEGNSN